MKAKPPTLQKGVYLTQSIAAYVEIVRGDLSDHHRYSRCCIGTGPQEAI